MKILNINLLKQELKLLNDKKSKNFLEVTNYLGVSDEKKVRKYSGYFRDGLDYYVDDYLEKNKDILSYLYEQLQVNPNIKFGRIIAINYIVYDHEPLNEINEKNFAMLLFSEDFRFRLVKTKDLTEENIQKCFEFLYKNSIDLKNKKFFVSNEKLLQKKCFEEISLLSNEELLNKNIFISTTQGYLKDVCSYGKEKYKQSKLKEIFNCSEHELAFFITGALCPFKGLSKYSSSAIINTYEEQGLNAGLKKIEELNNEDFKDNIYSRGYMAAWGYSVKNYNAVDNYIICIDVLEKYLQHVEWSDEENRQFNFQMLVEYCMLSLLEKDKRSHKEEDNYSLVLKNYLKSLPKEQRLNELMHINNFCSIYKIMDNQSYSGMFKLIDELDISDECLIRYISNPNVLKEDVDIILLQRCLNHKKMIDYPESENIYNTIYSIEDYLIIQSHSLEKNYLFEFDMLKDLCEKSFKKVDSSYTNKGMLIKIPKSEFLMFDKIKTPKYFFDFLLKKQVNLLNQDLLFNNYFSERNLNDKLSLLDEKKDNDLGKQKKKI